MKRTYVPISLLLFLVFIAISAMHAQHYDDLYYNPKTDYAYYYGGKSSVDKDKAERYDKPEDEQYEEGDEAYFYSSRIRRFHRPARFYYYEMWRSPWSFYDPWYMGPSIGMYNGFYPGYSFSYWNNWSPYYYGAYNSPWSFGNWNYGFYNPWGPGGNVIINNYYGNGWFGNGWSPYYTGWNNPFNNNFNPGLGGNWAGGIITNPKGVVTGPRQTGGISTPTPPRKNQYRVAEPIKNGRNPRVDAERAESINPAKPEPEKNIRGRDSRENPAIKDRSNDNLQNETPKRREPRYNQDKNPIIERPRRENEAQDNRSRSPNIQRDRNSEDNPRRKNSAESGGYRYTPPARSNDYERTSRQPSYETRSEPRSYDRSPRYDSSPSRPSSNSGSGSNNVGGGRRGRD